MPIFWQCDSDSMAIDSLSYIAENDGELSFVSEGKKSYLGNPAFSHLLHWSVIHIRTRLSFPSKIPDAIM
jgi:hypothetical protein